MQNGIKVLGKIAVVDSNLMKNILYTIILSFLFSFSVFAEDEKKNAELVEENKSKICGPYYVGNINMVNILDHIASQPDLKKLPLLGYEGGEDYWQSDATIVYRSDKPIFVLIDANDIKCGNYTGNSKYEIVSTSNVFGGNATEKFQIFDLEKITEILRISYRTDISFNDLNGDGINELVTGYNFRPYFEHCWLSCNGAKRIICFRNGKSTECTKEFPEVLNKDFSAAKTNLLSMANDYSNNKAINMEAISDEFNNLLNKIHNDSDIEKVSNQMDVSNIKSRIDYKKLEFAITGQGESAIYVVESLVLFLTTAVNLDKIHEAYSFIIKNFSKEITLWALLNYKNIKQSVSHSVTHYQK